jgi:hypothetical protein
MRRVEYWAQLGCPLYKALTRERTLDLATAHAGDDEGAYKFFPMMELMTSTLPLPDQPVFLKFKKT